VKERGRCCKFGGWSGAHSQPAVQLGALARLHSDLNMISQLGRQAADRQHRWWRLPLPAQLLWARLLYRSSRRRAALRLPPERGVVQLACLTCSHPGLSACRAERLCA